MSSPGPLALELVLGVALDIAASSEATLDTTIESSLEALGSAAAVDRTYVITFDEERRRFSNTHEWCAPGVTRHRDEIQNLPYGPFPWAIGLLRRGEVVRWGEGGVDPPEAADEIESFRRFGVRSVVEVPVRFDGRLLADLGFNSQRARRWTDDEIRSLRRVADALAVRVALRQKVEGAWAEADRLAAERAALAERLRTIGHDLRTPLQRIVSAASFAERGDVLPPQAVLGLARGTAELRSAVEGLLGSALPDEPDTEPRSFDLLATAREIADRFDLVVDGSDALLVDGDPDLLTALFGEIASLLEPAAGRLVVSSVPPARGRLAWEITGLTAVPEVSTPETMAAVEAVRRHGGHVSFLPTIPVTLAVDLDIAVAPTVAMVGFSPEEEAIISAVLDRRLGVVAHGAPALRTDDLVLVTATDAEVATPNGTQVVVAGTGPAVPGEVGRLARPVPAAELVSLLRALLRR